MCGATADHHAPTDVPPEVVVLRREQVRRVQTFNVCLDEAQARQEVRSNRADFGDEHRVRHHRHDARREPRRGAEEVLGVGEFLFEPEDIARHAERQARIEAFVFAVPVTWGQLASPPKSYPTNGLMKPSCARASRAAPSNIVSPTMAAASPFPSGVPNRTTIDLGTRPPRAHGSGRAAFMSVVVCIHT